jgi:ppGpp synthetase/RelA/SpoT-type nucleotidyltranferase
MKFPSKYDKNEYIAWHENKFKDDKSLESKLEEYRNSLKVNVLSDLEFISNIIQSVSSIASNEFRIQHGVALEADLPLIKTLINKKTSQSEYDLLFKSVDSTINKLWRKNKEGDEVQISNIQENITDLVRTEIITPTLESCKFLAERLERHNIYFPDKKQEKEFKEKVKGISFEPEMKMASGYFAYHGKVEFSSGITIEVQIYSSLMKSWRKLSHKLYEKARIRTKDKQLDYGTSETRLISLGHLLHLAECELTRLDSEL